ncbi:MAG: hypothetical protein ABSH41_30390 [Syntrophobacteraceae bacterium]|jgi:hypothetical protein
MNDANRNRGGWKSKAIGEMTDYYITFLYLAYFFGSFTSYRRLILGEHQIGYLHYGVGLTQALVRQSHSRGACFAA